MTARTARADALLREPPRPAPAVVFAPLDGPARHYAIMIWTALATSVPYVCVCLWTAGLSRAALASDAPEAFESRFAIADVAYLVFAIMSLPVWVYASIAYLVWIHRVASNVARANPDAKAARPVAAVAWHFAPVLWWIAPFLNLLDFERESRPASPGPRFAPLLAVYWASVLLYAGVAGGGVWLYFAHADALAAAPGPELRRLDAWIGLATQLAGAVAALLSLLVVRRLTAAQTARFAAAPPGPVSG